jgi:hypothetical protein
MSVIACSLKIKPWLPKNERVGIFIKLTKMKTLNKILIAIILFANFNMEAKITIDENYAGNATISYENSQQQTQKDKEFVKTELKKGMALFVESLRPNYKKGMDYKSFVSVLVGENATEMSTEGQSLLKKSYNYLSKGVSFKEIERTDSMKEIAAAALYVHNFNVENKSSNGDLALFGLDNDNYINNTVTLSKSGGCKWWQLRCHLQSIFGDDGGDAILNAIVDIILDLLRN